MDDPNLEDEDAQPPAQGSEEIQRLLADSQAYAATLPPVERRVVTMAAAGAPVWEIAQQTRQSEAAVWRTINGAIATVTGREVNPIETGGFGSDTDPGVTGGYGDTGFGALDTEPIPDNTEPEEGQGVRR